MDKGKSNLKKKIDKKDKNRYCLASKEDPAKQPG
jgi:hypothetical protein